MEGAVKGALIACLVPLAHASPQDPVCSSRGRASLLFHLHPSPHLVASSTRTFSGTWRNQKLWVLKHNSHRFAFALVNE